VRALMRLISGDLIAVRVSDSKQGKVLKQASQPSLSTSSAIDSSSVPTSRIYPLLTAQTPGT
jgi:hypothetical protein